MDARLWSVVRVTQHFRIERWPGADAWYVVSMDQAGNPIGADDLGRIITYDHDANEMIEVAPDFESFLVRCLQS